MSLIAEKIGQIFEHAIKKSQLFISKSSGVRYKFFNEALQPGFFAEKMTVQKR
jgi:hypothetical protein